MKKMLTFIGFVFLMLIVGPRWGFAETPAGYSDVAGGTPITTYSATVQAIADQVKASLSSDLVAAYAHTSHDEDKIYAVSSLWQFLKFHGGYIFGIHAGGIGSTINDQGHLNWTAGIHAHITDIVIAEVPMNPDLKSALSHVEVTPIYSYDNDVHHAVLSYMLGLRASFQ